MEQSKFILEIQSRPCIWNPRVPSYLDRVLKRQAWEEVAAKMYRGYDRCTEIEKIEKVRELQKKWKSLRDYYKRRNPKEDIDRRTQQKKPIVELLSFLDKFTKLDHHIRAQQRLAKQIKKIKNNNLVFQLPDYKITVQKFNDNQPPKPNTRKINFRSTKFNLENESKQNEEIKFLYSLLPVMQSLTDRQRFDFKLEVMMLIKKVKYEDDTLNNTEVSEQNSSLSYNRPAVIEVAPRSMPTITIL